MSEDFDFGEWNRPMLRCPKCNSDSIAQSYVPGVNGTRVVTDPEPDADGKRWSHLEPGTPAAYVCGDCEYETPTDRPFIEAGVKHKRRAEAQRKRRAREARERAETAMAALAERLVGRTITATEFHAEDPAPGFGGDPGIEGATLTLDDGTTLHLRAFGWHNIQSLDVTIT